MVRSKVCPSFRTDTRWERIRLPPNIKKTNSSENINKKILMVVSIIKNSDRWQPEVEQMPSEAGVKKRSKVLLLSWNWTINTISSFILNWHLESASKFFYRNFTPVVPSYFLAHGVHLPSPKKAWYQTKNKEELILYCFPLYNLGFTFIHLE